LAANTDESYFQKYSSNQVAWHCESFYNQKSTIDEEDGKLAFIRRHPNEGASEILVYCKDRKGLFSDICFALYELQLTIVNATIHTLNDGFCIDTFIVLELDGTPITSSRRNQLIVTVLKKKLTASDEPKSMVRSQSKYRHFDIKTQCHFNSKQPSEFLELMIITLDRPGFLAKVGAIFNQLNIRLHGAKIATFGEKTEDLFLVTLNSESEYYKVKDLSQLENQLNQKLDKQD